MMLKIGDTSPLRLVFTSDGVGVGVVVGVVKADLHGTIFPYDCRMRFL